jgi:protein-serine/threonine kinase
MADGTTSASASANAARSRRRGPASPEGPQRAISTRESAGRSSPTAVQSRSASHVALAAPSSKATKDESQIIGRVVVDDPIVDIKRAQERQLESVPGLAVVTNDATEHTAKPTPRSRQDKSASSESAERRKEIKFGEYILGQTLGEGEFGKVKLGWKKGGAVQVAIKLIRRETLHGNPSRLPKIYREVHILRGLEHPNIVRLHEMIETSQFIGIILEYASGGELFDFILTNRYLKDNTARKLFAQLVSGVGYLHKKGIVHRDLKLENLLLDRNRNIVITDFGFANTFNPQDELEDEIEQNLTDRNFVKRRDLDRMQENGSRRGDLMATSCGSPCYAAPELVVTDSLYTGRKVDVWSCGVILVRRCSKKCL